MNQLPVKYCHACGREIDARAQVCPDCGVAQPHPPLPGDDPEIRAAGSNKIAAGICAILIGHLGIHKFILGMTNQGLIMLLVSLLTCGIGAIPMSIIGIVEGVIYLTRSDEEFFDTYVVEKKGWF